MNDAKIKKMIIITLTSQQPGVLLRSQFSSKGLGITRNTVTDVSPRTDIDVV